MTKTKSSLNNFKMEKHFIFTGAAKISDFASEEFDDDAGWQEKSRRLQLRRWRKIRQLEGI